MPRAGLDKKTSADLVRLLIFMVTTALATSLLVVTIGNLSFGSTTKYRAEFTDATGVVEGDDIRVAGVKVGTVQDVEIHDESRAMVTFEVSEGTDMDTATHAAIRYRNLIGQRYIALTHRGDGDDLGEDDVIPVNRTQPALDLTVLFNGFKPLFEALSPDDINKLSYEIVQVFQGEGGTLESLLSTTASVTSTLARRDRVIGDLLDNLDYVLDHIADRDEQLTQLIGSFRTLVGGLKADRNAILSSLDSISDLSVQTAGLVDDIREPLVRDIKQLRRVAGHLDEGKAEIDRTLQVLPIKLTKVGRTAIDGSWFNFYLCHFAVRVRHGKNSIVPPGENAEPLNFALGNYDRCNLG